MFYLLMVATVLLGGEAEPQCSSTEEVQRFLKPLNDYRADLAKGLAVGANNKKLPGSRAMFELTWSCELELIAAVNTIGCKKVFLPEGTSMNYLMVPFMDVPFGKGVLLSFAMADWKKNSLHIGMDDDVTFTDASLEEFANMIYYKSIAVGCSYSACPFPPQSEAIACVFSSVPTLNSQIYEPDSKAIGCSNDFDCSKIVPDAVCDLLNGLCITEVNQAFPTTVAQVSTTPTTHTSPSPSTTPSPFEMDDDIRIMVVDLHNNRRSLLATGNVINGRTGSNCKPAKNMLEMKYDRSLEVEAQIYANKCPQSEVSSPVALRPRSGENVKIIWSDNIPYMEAVVAAAQSWWDEIAIESINPSMLFIRRLLSKPLAPIRFTQMAWATTFRVGCGVNRCKGFTVVACRYRPRGNIVGQFVYRVGPTCDECRYHCIAKEGLCLAPLA
ncbi:hypothetical protein Q1695_008289 [Nippostrongylus brasiliensis]|nr:hypothetical protein Q1695_008289 [Nippostrongylus brasiliensis]